MRKVVLVVMLVVCLFSINASAWAAGSLAKGNVVYQGEGPPKDPPK